MDNNKTIEIRASDLPIALYLNQRVTFDLLAVMEGGFARVTTVQESSSRAKHSGVEGSVGLGTSNPFAFLGFTFGAQGHRDTATASGGVTTEELVHTPTSLFARLRQELMRRGLVRTIENESADFDTVAPGEFVEFRAVLRRSPLVDVLDTFQQFVPMMAVFDGAKDSPRKGGRKQRGDRRKNLDRTAQMLQQIAAIRDAVSADGSQDLIAECGVNRFVLATEEAFFVDPSMNDVIDGTFRVFGKITRVVPKNAPEGISLFRKSAIGNFGGIVSELGSSLASLGDVGFTGQKVETQIPAPTLQVIPIGIFA